MGKGVHLAVVFAAYALIACFTGAIAQPDRVNVLEQVSKGLATTQQGSAAPEQQHLPKPRTDSALESSVLEQQGNEQQGGGDGSGGEHSCIVHADATAALWRPAFRYLHSGTL